MLAALVDLASKLQQLPDIHVPLIGNRWAVGGAFLTHVVFGSFTMGTLLLSPTFEWIGDRRGDARWTRLARGLGEVNVRIFSIGATLAGFAVVFLTALYPRFFIPLFEMFFWPMLGAFMIWFPAIACLYIYVHNWDRMRERHRGRHVALGYAAAFFDHVFLFLIVGVDSYLLTPGGGASAFFNASYLPELLHRVNGNVSWASFFIAGVLAVMSALDRSEEDRAFHLWATRLGVVLGVATLLLQVPLGFFFAESVKSASPGAFDYSFRGNFAWLWLVQGALLSVLLVGSNVYFTLTRRTPLGNALVGVTLVLGVLTVMPSAVYPHGLFWLRYVALGVILAASLVHLLLWRRARGGGAAEARRGARATLAVVAVSAVSIFLLMGVIRTTARGDYTIYGKQREVDSFGQYNPPAGQYP